MYSRPFSLANLGHSRNEWHADINGVTVCKNLHPHVHMCVNIYIHKYLSTYILAHKDSIYGSVVIWSNICLFQAARPLISVYNEKGEVTDHNVKLPAIFRAPIRPDIVNFVHSEMRKNSRQPYAVSEKAGGSPVSRDIPSAYDESPSKQVGHQ